MTASHIATSPAMPFSSDLRVTAEEEWLRVSSTRRHHHPSLNSNPDLRPLIKVESRKAFNVD